VTDEALPRRGTWDACPNEVVVQQLLCCSRFEDLASLSCASRRLAQLARTPCVVNLWRRLRRVAHLKRRAGVPRLDVFYGRTDNERGCKQYGAVVVFTTAKKIDYYDDVYEPKGEKFKVLCEIGDHELRRLAAQEPVCRVPSSSGWVQPPLRDRVFAAAFQKKNFGYDDNGVCDQDRAYDEWLNAALPRPTPPKIRDGRDNHYGPSANYNRPYRT